jgi:hypothetical protein
MGLKRGVVSTLPLATPLMYGKGPCCGPGTQLLTTSSTTETIYPTTLKLNLNKEQKNYVFSMKVTTV